MADRTLPDLVGPKAWRNGGAWKWSTRVVAGLTAFTFTLLQFTAPFASADQQPALPDWLKEENGGWVSQEQAGRMQKADQDLLTHLSMLEQAQERFVTTHPSGLEVQYANQEAVVARDSAGNLLWTPTLDDYRKVQNGTLLLVDGTLQVVKNGQLARQVDAMGNEAAFRTDGRVDHETAVDGTRTDYAYSESGFTRTTHHPNGDLVQEYNTEGRLIRETTPEGALSTYSNGILATVTAGGFLYTYSSETVADGVITATLSEARGADGAVYTFSNGELATIRWFDGTLATGVQLDAQGNVIAGSVLLPDGTQQTIAAGSIRDVLLPDERMFHYDTGWLRQLQVGSVSSAYSYTFNAEGNLNSIIVTAADGSSRAYSAEGTLQGLTDSNGTQWTVADGLITQSTSPAGSITTYSRINSPTGQQMIRQTGGVTDRFSFDASGTLYAAGSDRNLIGPTPFTTPLQSFTAGTLKAAGIVATDGTYLYVKAWGSSSKIFTKVGTGLGGTVAGKTYGTLTGTSSGTISATMHSDGFLYQPYSSSPLWMEQLNPATGSKTLVYVPAGLIRLETAKAEKGNALITSDGRYVYNLSYHQTRNSTTLNGWTVRVFDPKNGWALVKEFTAGTTSFKANGLMSDGTFLYALEWTGTNSARVAVIRISDGAVVQTWTANQKTTVIVNGQYDWVNQRFWMGAKSNGKIYAYDNPNDLSLSAWVDREGLRSPIAQTQLPDMNRVRQPDNSYSTDLQARIAQDLPGIRLTYPGLPSGPGVDRPDGIWNQVSWTITADTLPPTGAMELPTLTDQREITMTLSALDPASADGTTGSGVLMMRFSFDQGATWSDPEPLAAEKTVTLPEQNGDYTLQVQFRDVAGHWSEPVARTVTLRLGGGTELPPVLSLVSAETTDSELYDFLFAADGVVQPSQRWRIGRGRHLLIASAASPAGIKSWAGYAVLRSGEPLPEPTEPLSLPEGAQVTQTLADGSVALFIEGTLVSVTTPDGTKLLHPVLDETGRITGGWLITPDGTTTFLQAGAAVWSKDSFGAVTWYFPDGRPEAVRGKDGTLTSVAYRLDEAGQVAAALITTGDTSALLTTDGKLVMQLRADGSRLSYIEGRLSAIESVGQPAIRYTESVQSDGSIVSERPGSAATDLPKRWVYAADGSLREVTQADGTVIRLSAGIPIEAVAPDGTVTSFSVAQADSVLKSISVTRNGIARNYDSTGGIRQITLPDQAALELQGETAQSLSLADGTRVSDGVYDADSRLVSGIVTLPDGRIVRYADGQPVEATLPDGSHVTYSAGVPAGLMLSNGSTYTFTHETDGWVATLTLPSEGTAGSDPLTQMVYSEEWVLQEATRADGAQMVYVDGFLNTLTQTDGTVISYAYDAVGRLANTVAVSPNAGEPVIRTEYAYDRIRKIFKGETLIYEYSYEFDADGNEITTLRDLQANRVKRYRDSLLISQTDPDGAVTTYAYTTNPAGYQNPMENALEARQMLPDGSAAYYRRSSNTSPWQLDRIVLPSGAEYTDLAHPDIAGQVREAELPPDRLSLFRLQRQGRLEAAGAAVATAGSGPSKIAAATVYYQERVRASYTYQYEGTLTRVTDQEGATRVYDESNTLVAIEQIEGASYSVSTARDLSAEQEAQLAELDPSSPEALEILTHPDGEEISVHRLTRLTLADGTVVMENFAPDTLVTQEFDSQGRLLTRSQANGQITLYEDGRPTQTLDTKGNVTTSFTYNEAGQLVKLTLHGARRELAEETAAARAEVIRKRADALEELAIRKQLAIGQVADQTAQARAQLQGQLVDLQQKLNDLENTDVRGKKAKKQKGQALDQIRHGMNQVREALSSIDQQYSQALGSLESQVESVRNQLESQSASAFVSITAKEEEFTRQIILQEVTVILTRVYRNVIGRDPDEEETSQAVDPLYAQFGADPEAALDLTALEQKIKTLPDYPARVQQVAQIRQAVSDRLAGWETASQEQKEAQLAPYGVNVSEVVPLNAESIAEIRDWLNTNSLHFGHSAFLALQGLLAQAEGIQVDAVTLAVEAIWLDILTGVISPRTTGDLELSLFSMGRVAQRYGLSVTPARVSLDDLTAMLPRELTLFQEVSPDGQTSYELKENGTLEIVDLATNQTVRTIPIFEGIEPPEPSISLLKQPDGTLLFQTKGLPVGGFISLWTENDLAGEAKIYYIKPVDKEYSYTSLPADGVARLPSLSYRPGHTRVLVLKDAQAVEVFQQKQREYHFWAGAYATNFIKDNIASDLNRMKNDPAFMSATGLMVFDMAGDGSLVRMEGFWNPPPEPGFVPQQTLLSPDGNTLWVIATGKNLTGTVLLSVDLRTGIVTRADAELGSPTQLAVSPDGTKIYVHDAFSPEGGSSALAVLDAATGQTLRRTKLSVRSLSGLAFTANNRVMVAGKGGDSIFFLDPNWLHTLWTISGFSALSQVTLRPDGQVAYLLDAPLREVIVMSVSSGEILARILADGASDQVAFSPDGAIVYITRSDTGTVLRIDASSHQPISDPQEGESALDQAFRRRTAPILAHVNGNHYLHVLAVTADGKILVREPNKGPNGSIVTLSAEEFSRIWQGVILSPRAPPHAYQRLTDSEALSITGSFFPALIAIFVAVAAAIGTAVTAIVGAVAALLATLGSVLASVFSALGTAFSSIGSFFGGFGSLFSGTGLIGQGVSALFAGKLLTGLALIGKGILGAVGLASFSWASLGQFALTTAVNVGISRGLETLGVSPTVASLAGAFVSGGISGALNPVGTTSSFLTDFAAGALTSTAVAGTQIGLIKAGLDPALANIAGIGVGTITNSLAISGLEGLGQTLSTQLAPTLAGELAFYGVQKLGETIGLDSRISQLAGMTISSGIRNIANGANLAGNVLQGMQDGLTRGALSIGLQFATQGLDPLVGNLASSVITGAIDGLFSPNVERDPQTGEPVIDPATGKLKYRDSNGDGVIDQRDAKGIFAGIGESLLGAVGGFTEIGIIKPGDPVGNAQRLAQLNDFSTVIRDQGLGAALETYATSLLHRSSIESILNAGTSIRQYGTIQESIEVALTPPDPEDTRPRLHVEEVEFEGRQVLQILFADGGYLLAEKDTHNLIAIQEGNQLIRLNGSPKVDEATRTAAITEATIERTYRDLAGAEVTARVLQEVSAGGVISVTIEGKDGVRYTVTPNSFQHVRLNADGTVKDGVLTEVQTGNTLYFLNGTLVASHAKPFANVQIPDDFQAEILQAELDVIQTPDGGLDVRIKTPEFAVTPPEVTEPQKTVGGDLRADLAQRVGDIEAQRIWDGIQALVPQNQAMPNVAVVLQPAKIETEGGAFGSTAASYEKGSFYKGDVPRDSSAMVKVDLATGTISLSGGGKAVIDNGQGTGGMYWSTSSTGGLFPDAIGTGVATSSQMTDSLVIQNAYGLKATGLSFSKVVGEYKRTTILGNSIEIMTVTKEPNPWVKDGIRATETILALWGVWGLTKAGAWGVGRAADEIGEVAPTLLEYFQKAFAAVT